MLVVIRDKFVHSAELYVEFCELLIPVNEGDVTAIFLLILNNPANRNVTVLITTSDASAIGWLC